ncbi:MAG: hypothetical protein V1735_07160 [Nanoarchaeota archaeon]
MTTTRLPPSLLFIEKSMNKNRREMLDGLLEGRFITELFIFHEPDDTMVIEVQCMKDE